MKKSATVLSAFAFAALALSAPAMAASQTNTQSLSTAQVKQLIQENGAVVLSTSANTFDRYVANPGDCFRGQTASVAYVPTADSSSAQVGFTCSVDSID
ncbi:hypothetical protein [uncultured Cohaesibacter sp.]|uniref:hypothetical protein n=1 Tax=uncultured Cohaesibacter sp. TaxID=1002546 RepID=UPI0029C72504|nr:hypothetical protein [uncultured Cohaesibacter sp.]